MCLKLAAWNAMSLDEYGGERERYECILWLVHQQHPNQEELYGNKTFCHVNQGGLEESATLLEAALPHKPRRVDMRAACSFLIWQHSRRDSLGTLGRRGTREAQRERKTSSGSGSWFTRIPVLLSTPLPMCANHLC